jgi:ATP-dependent RNA helicase SUPV3L1/SUV3
MTTTPQTFNISNHGITAVLGPTNTGKTHFAIERMLAHKSGVIGLPLRLLAREVYTRICEKIGAEHVALITGEEKIIPHTARYWICTVEAMPHETKAAFVAIDEVQLAHDLERGHVFTNRILHLRGTEETLLLGAESMHGILVHLLPGIKIVTRPRLSQLLFSGAKKITRLPTRSAIVAFSTDEVYAIAELIRRQRGGAAVVTGALSPRTRNAQVELYENGDVDFLVATDAIGMGLNLDVHHVAFAQLRKFDGWHYRDLTPSEIAQVAGRAGRHVRDGTFGTTGRAKNFDEQLVQRIESHYFEPVRVLQWRSSQLDFSTIDSLLQTLDSVAPFEGLTRALPSADAEALNFLIKDEDIKRIADKSYRVETLWDACSLPDYRNIAPAHHAEIVGAIFLDLVKRGFVNEKYMSDQVKQADNSDGDIDTLSQRIAQIRTWTYVSHRLGWLEKPHQWQEETKEIENRLSDALHERLTQRFVDRRTSVLMKRLRENIMLVAEITVNGDVLVEGHIVGQLHGFRFSNDRPVESDDAKTVQTAAMKSLAVEYDARAYRFAACSNADIALGTDGYIRWLGAPIATLVASDDFIKPRIVLLADEQLAGGSRDLVEQRVNRFFSYQVEQHIKPLVDLSIGEGLEGISKGIAYRLYEAQGVLKRKDIATELKELDQESRGLLRKIGIRFGAYHVFLPALLKPAPAQLITLLWALKNDAKEDKGYLDVVAALAAGRTSLVSDNAFNREFYRISGFRYLGKRAVRIDMLERLADFIRPLLMWKIGSSPRPLGAYDDSRFIVTPAMLSILGASMGDMEEILKGLGYRCDALPAADVEKRIAEIDASSTPDTPESQELIIERVVKQDVTTVQDMASPEEEVKVTLLWKQGRSETKPSRSNVNRVEKPTASDVKEQAANWDKQHKRFEKNNSKPQFNRNKKSEPPKNGDRKPKGETRREERPVVFDPNSPFAKLAALRDALKKE